eukprot:7183545-Prymnesium_polylepis.1
MGASAAAVEAAAAAAACSSSSSMHEQKARAIRSCACAAQSVPPGACARACGDRNLSPAQQAQSMPLYSRSDQLSIVIDPARLSQRARRADRP